MATQTEPQRKDATFTIEPWNVILLNDEYHTFEEVIIQLMKATGCTPDQAAAIALDVHNKGMAICFTGSRERCELVAEILEEIDLAVRLEPA